MDITPKVEKRKKELEKVYGPISFSETDMARYRYIVASYNLHGQSKCVGVNVSQRLYESPLLEEAQIQLLNLIESHERNKI